MSKRVILDRKVFPSIANAAAYAGCDRSTMHRAIKRGGAVWANPLHRYVRPKAVSADVTGVPYDGEIPYEVVTDTLTISCPCCGNHFEVKVSLS